MFEEYNDKNVPDDDGKHVKSEGRQKSQIELLLFLKANLLINVTEQNKEIVVNSIFYRSVVYVYRAVV